MKRLLFDVESNGFLEETTVLHCLWIMNVDTGEVTDYADQPGHRPIREGLKQLESADQLIGHNIIRFDVPVLRKLYPELNLTDNLFDTHNASRLIWADISESDFRRYERDKSFPAQLIGKHTLKAWGYRLGILKGTYGEQEDAFAEWSPEMHAYCAQDIKVNFALLELIWKQNFSETSFQLEMDFQKVIHRQEEVGFPFDEASAAKLNEKLVARKLELTDQLRDVFKPKYQEMKTPQYWEWVSPFGGEPIQAETKKALTEKLRDAGIKPRPKPSEFRPGPNKVREIPFNPGSRDDIAARLMEKYGWKPTKFTDGGKPQVDESVLETLDYPEAKLLNEYLLVSKRLGQISDGKEGWLRNTKDGRIHGAVITNGAVTGRCAHFKPNVAQVPKVGSPYGTECRSLFTCDPGYVMVGCDASGLELRCFAHFLARHDNGAYAEIVLHGDVHTENQKAAGLPTRNDAKTFIYALLYGAGDYKLGSIPGVTPEDIALYKTTENKRWREYLKKAQRINKRAGKDVFPVDDRSVATSIKGSLLRESFMDKLPAYRQLVEGVQAVAKERKWIRGLDGRRLHVRSAHSALNTLLQSAGALLVKKATVILHERLAAAGLKHAEVIYRPDRRVIVPNDYAQLAHVHDEFQLQCRPELAEFIGQTAVESIRAAGEFFNFRVPLDGEFKIGRNWAETH